MGEPLVSVIIVTLDHIPLLGDCLRSLQIQTYKNLEIIVVDNGSTEDIGAFIRAEFPGVKVVRLPKNEGFAGGNNAGYLAAKGEFMALINNDAVASAGWIGSMIDVARGDEKIGSVASIIIDGNDEKILDSCGLGIAFDGMSRQRSRGATVPVLEAPVEVLMPSGCACLFRKSALRETGFFDEDFFAYCEDADLGLRLRLAGWKCVAAPGAYVTHHYSMTGGKYSLKKAYLVERNHFWVAMKNFPAILVPIVPLVTLWRYLLQAFLILTGSSQLSGFTEKARVTELAKTILSAIRDSASGIPSALKKRGSFRNFRRSGTCDMLKLLIRYRLPMKKILGG